MNRKLCGLIILIFLFPPASFSQFRKYSNEFLNIGAGARGLAMGGAQIASVKNATAGYWNPAGLTGVKDDLDAQGMIARYFSGIGKYDYISVALPIQNNKRTLGLSFLRFGVDDIPNTLYLVEPDGSINYNNVQSFSSSDCALLLSMAQKIRESRSRTISVGGNVKIIYRKVGKFANAWGFGLDAGVQMKGERWTAAVVIKDITTTFNAWSYHFSEREKEIFYLTNNKIPVQSTELTAPHVSIGGGYKFNLGSKIKLYPEANLDLTFDGKRNTVISSKFMSIDPHIGLEFSLKDLVFVRAGITNFQKALSDGDTLNQKKGMDLSAQPGCRVQASECDN